MDGTRVRPALADDRPCEPVVWFRTRIVDELAEGAVTRGIEHNLRLAPRPPRRIVRSGWNVEGDVNFVSTERSVVRSVEWFVLTTTYICPPRLMSETGTSNAPMLMPGGWMVR